MSVEHSLHTPISAWNRLAGENGELEQCCFTGSSRVHRGSMPNEVGNIAKMLQRTKHFL